MSARVGRVGLRQAEMRRDAGHGLIIDTERVYAVRGHCAEHALIAAHARHIVTFEWVPGHSGERYNERCDELAGAARRSAPVQRQQPG